MVASCFSCWQWNSSIIDHKFQTNSIGIPVRKADGFRCVFKRIRWDSSWRFSTLVRSLDWRLLNLRKAIIWSIDIKNFLLRWLSGIIVPKDINIKRMMLPSNEIASKLQPSQVFRATSEYQASQKRRVWCSRVLCQLQICGISGGSAWF